jgi:hypothetical protein
MPSGAVVTAAAGGTLPPAPPVDRPRQRTAWQLRIQSRSCAAMGSPLYGSLLDRAADDCEAGGATWRVLEPHAGPGRADALALRLMAAVHRLVLQRRAPALATCYPSVGGTSGPQAAWPLFRATLEEQRDAVVELVGQPCQTNEVGRSAGLVVGLLDVALATRLPLRLLEVGASAGLNLRCDHFRIGGGGVALGDPDSPVDLASHWTVPPPHVPERLRVVERHGCDRAPLDPTTPEGRLRLTSSVWADQRARHKLLRGALQLAARVAAPVDVASLDDWTAARLADRPADAATVVFHSVVLEYLDDDTRQRFVATLRRAGERTTAQRPVAWVRLEPISALRHHGIQVTTWPGGRTRTLARCGAHGTDVTWLGDDNGPARR